jgi:hypothetical protein
MEFKDLENKQQVRELAQQRREKIVYDCYGAIRDVSSTENVRAI